MVRLTVFIGRLIKTLSVQKIKKKAEAEVSASEHHHYFIIFPWRFSIKTFATHIWGTSNCPSTSSKERERETISPTEIVIQQLVSFFIYLPVLVTNIDGNKGRNGGMHSCFVSSRTLIPLTLHVLLRPDH